MFEQFPYTDMHQLNLDWIVKIAKDFLDQYTHLQDLITQGETDISEEIASGLASIDQSAQQIRQDLDAWYAEHSQDMAQQLANDIETMQIRFGNLMSSIPADFSGLVSIVDSLTDSMRYALPENLLTTTPVEGYYISYETGAIGSNPDWAYYPEFEIEPGKYYYGSYNGAHVAFFDYNHTFISGVLINHQPTNADFMAPLTAKYATYSYNMASGNQYFVRSTQEPLQYIDPEFRKLESVVSANLVNLTEILRTGKNLFNKFNVIDGYSIDYGNASRLWRNVNYCYCPDYIPVKPNTTYHHNRGVIIGIFDKKCDLLQTLNHTTIADDTFTTGADAAFIQIGTTIAVKDILQVEEGSVGTNYDTFEVKFIHGSDADSSSTVIISVSPVGGDYHTITDAVAHATDGDIIIVHPGTYNESVKAYGKNIQIIGMDRASCILTYGGLDYANPPLEIAAGAVSNMTIKATNSGSQGSYNAYCVHVDNDNSENKGLSFRNVHFINEVHQCVGIGMRPHFEITFDSCIFNAQDQACLYCHDWETAESRDKSGQRLIVRNCTLENNSAVSATIMLQSQELQTDCASALFLANSLVNEDINGSIISMVLWDGRTLTNNGYLGSSDWLLELPSANNTDNLLNNIKNASRNDILIETKNLSNPEPVPANTVKSYTIDVSKTGYSAEGIVEISGSGTTGLIIQEFFVIGGIATVYMRNATASQISPSRIEMTIIYKAI